MGNKQNKGTADVAGNATTDPLEQGVTAPGREEDSTVGPAANAHSSISQSPRDSRTKKSVNRKERTKSAIPPDKFEKFLICLKELPFNVNENELKNIAENLEVVTVDKSDIILKKGEPGKGIYLVVDGFCTVVTVSGDVLRVVKDQDFFGEVSSFYDRACSATVLCGRDSTELLWLPKSILEQFIHRPVEFPILKWFVARRYLDIEGTSIQKDVIQELLTETVIQAPLFHEWSSAAINCVVRSVIDDQNVVFYSAESEIFSSGEIDTNGFLLLQGDIEILSGYQQSLEILSAGSSGLWFGDEQLFCSTQREISARAHSPCIIAVFTRSHFKKIEENFPAENAKLMALSLMWKKLIENRDTKLHEKYAGQLGLEMTRLVLRRSPLFPLVPPGMIYYLGVNLIHRQLKKDELVFAENQKRDKMFVVFTGVVTVQSDSTVSTKQLEVSDIYYPTEDEPDDVMVRASEECIVGLFDVTSFKYAHDLYPDGIIVWGNAAQ